MKVQCNSCGTRLNVPDEKLPLGGTFNFTCPKCKTRNTVDVTTSGAESQPAADLEAPQETPEPTLPPARPAASDFAEGELDGALSDFFEEGSKPALICFPESANREILADMTRGLGYVPLIPGSARDAIRRMRLTQYRLVLMHEDFGTQPGGPNPFLDHIQNMDMHVRRRMFVALFGKNFQTMDQMAAFALSVNLVVNLGDDSQFEKVLVRSLAEYERFYKVYFDVLRELGKM